jgi:predicted Zn-dependent protease
MKNNLSEEWTRGVLSKALSFSKADGAEVLLFGGYHALTRFAENQIHQNVSEEGYILSVRSIIGKRTARAQTNVLSEEGIRQVVKDSEEIASFMPEDPELLDLPAPQEYQDVKAYDQGVLEFTPQLRAEKVNQVIRFIQKNGASAAGAFSVRIGTFHEPYEDFFPFAMANSRGLFAFHRYTGFDFSITVNFEGATGWAAANSYRLEDIDPLSVAEVALRKANLSRDPKELPPGRYDVLLEPEAAGELFSFLASGFSAQHLEDGESFLIGRVGQKIAGENFTMLDDAYHPLQRGIPFDAEGIPRRRVFLFEKGIAKNLIHDRRTAKRYNTSSTGHALPLPNRFGGQPVNIVVEGTQLSPEELLKSLKKGILVTRFWYTNFVDKRRCIVTGMTRDGTFYVEDGQVKYPVKNFRFNQDLVELVGNIVGLSKSVRTTSMVAPAIIVKDFTFTSLTEGR